MNEISEDRGFLYGDALFETVRVRAGRVRWLERHIERARRSWHELGFSPERFGAFEDALSGLPEREDGIWRVTASRDGAGVPFGGGPGVVVARHRSLFEPEPPALVTMAGWYWPGDPLAGHKTTSWLRWAEARRRARAEGADDALLVSHDGAVGEASAANVFVSLKGVLVTPALGGILPGVTREGILARAAEEGVVVEQRRVERAELDEAESILSTSAGVGVVAARSLDGRALGDTWLAELRRWLEEA